MTTRRVVSLLAAALGILASTAGVVVSACAAPARNAPATSASSRPGSSHAAASASLTDTAADTSHTVARSHETIDGPHLALGRAAMAQSVGNLRGVVEWLEPIADVDQPTFDEADRAAFLLGEAYLRLGSADRFVALARRTERWRVQTALTRWLAWQRLVVEAGVAIGSPGGAPRPDGMAALDSAAAMGSGPAATLAAGFLLGSGDAAGALRLMDSSEEHPRSAVRLYLHALALDRTGGDSRPDLEALASLDTLSSLGRDLAGAAWLQLAVRASESGADPREALEHVPVNSRFASRARHLLALNDLERGERDHGVERLREVTADSAYTDRREALLALAGEAVERGDWAGAESTYEALDSRWLADRAMLERRADGASFEDLWNEWHAQPLGSAGLTLDALTADLLAQHLANTSADLTRRPAVETPAIDALAHHDAAAAIAPPVPADWDSIRASEAGAAAARAQLERARWAAEKEREGLSDRQRYYALGLDRVRAEAEHLLARATLMNSLEMTIGSVDQELRAVRDEECRRVALRTTTLIQSFEKNERWIAAMRWSALGGADSTRERFAPAGYPRPDSVLAAERVLGETARSIAESLAVRAPEMIRRSYGEAWRPSLIDRAAAQDSSAGHALAWAHAVAASIDSVRREATSGEKLRGLEAEVASLGQAAERDRLADAALHDRVARRTIANAVAALDSSREAIDYGLAASAYALAVRLSASDSAKVQAKVARLDELPASRDTTAATTDEDTEDPAVTKWRATAIQHLQSFLAQHPNSFARGEMRFRLADLELIEARRTFRAEMALYVKAQAEGHAAGIPVPLQGHGAALDLYRRMLAEDHDFAHLDAVLFNAGMILADEGDAEAARFFSTLVQQYPNSTYDQEAWLRMGDMAFTDKRFPESVTQYDHAARGADPTLQAIAYYKMGWAHFNEDRFAEAADAFGAVLDLYASEKRAAIQVDIEGEANGYLVYSLAGAGGASAFASHFDRAGHRPYERHALLSLGQHFRRYGEFPSAAACDQLYLDRFPLDAEALLSATRLVETYQRSNRPALEQETRLAQAPRFAPNSDWANAQSSDSVRTAGSDFAHASWTAVAFEHHRRARDTGAREDWASALTLYQTLLAHWPNDLSAPSLELDAGEACVHLGDRAAALEHYRLAAATGADSIAAPAMWQRVAVTDAWYESTRPAAAARGPVSTGNDTLAHAVIEAGDALLQRFPSHTRAADIVWRQSQLSLAHGWNDRALADLARLAERFPSDARAPQAANQRGEILFNTGAFAAAGQAFETALAVAQHAGRDSLARRAAAAIPVCYYRQAEAAVAADSTRYAEHAELFQKVATGWPSYEHADLAQYRAALAWSSADRTREAVDAMHAVIRHFPKSDLVRDAHVQVAKLWEAAGERDSAAIAYEEFARHYPTDASAAGAWLKAADLLALAGHGSAADGLRLDYMKRYPNDAESAMEILETLAKRDLATVDAQHPISKLLGTPARKGQPAKPAASHLAEYIHGAAVHPKLASPAILAQVRFLQGEEAFAAFGATKLAQPLAKFLPAKQRSLDSVLVRYKRSADLKVAEWAHASAYRIGEALVGFAEALQHCERPADLQGDDLKAYEDVLFEQSRTFSERGEDVWTELLRQTAAQDTKDTWTDQAQGALWHRLGDRFFYRPEMEFPLVDGKAPGRGASRDSGKLSDDGEAQAPPSVARRDGGPR